MKHTAECNDINDASERERERPNPKQFIQLIFFVGFFVAFITNVCHV